MERLKKRMLAAVVTAHLCNDASVVVLPTIFPILKDKKILLEDYSSIGNMILAGLGVALACQALIGHRARPRHTRWLLALNAAITGVFLILITTSTSYWSLVMFYVGIRIGTSIYHPAGIGWVSHSFSGHSLDRAMGIQSAFGDLGVLFAFISTGFLVDHLGWKVPLYAWGAVNLIAVPVILGFSRGTLRAEDVAEQKENEKERLSWKKAFLAFRIFIPLSLIGGLAWGITLNYSPLLFRNRLDLSMSTIGTVMALWITAGTLSAVFYGKIARTLTRRKALLGAYAILGAGAFTLAMSSNHAFIFVLFTASGLALFITYPALLSYISDSVDMRHRTTTFSINANLGIVGNSIFASISGHFSDAWGIQAPFYLLGGACLVGLAYMAFIIRSGRISVR